jgi:hypothetical protein
MTLEYFYKTGEIHRRVDYGDGSEQEWDGDDGYDFEFKIDSEQIKTALVWAIKNKVKGDLKHKSFYPDKYPMVNGLKDFVNRKFTDAENEFIDALLREVLNTIEEDDELEEFAEWYREEIAEYYEDEAMETQEG